MTVTLAKYVVTFDPRPVTDSGAIKGLRQTGITYARQTARMAAIKRGRIINSETLREVTS